VEDKSVAGFGNEGNPPSGLDNRPIGAVASTTTTTTTTTTTAANHFSATYLSFFSPLCVSIFPLSRLAFFSPLFFHPAFPAAGAGNRRSAVRADGNYRYNVIADTGRGRGRGSVPRLRLPSERYIDLFSSFAYELFRFGSPGVYSRMKICSAAKYFSVLARALSGRAFHASPSPYDRHSPWNAGQFHPACIYTRVRIFSAATCARERARACVTTSVRRWALGEGERKINNCRKEFIGLSCARRLGKRLARRRFFLIISLLRGVTLTAMGE